MSSADVTSAGKLEDPSLSSVWSGRPGSLQPRTPCWCPRVAGSQPQTETEVQDYASGVDGCRWDNCSMIVFSRSSNTATGTSSMCLIFFFLLLRFVLMSCRKAGGDERPWEERRCLHACSQSALHGADQTAAELVGHTPKGKVHPKGMFHPSTLPTTLLMEALVF